MKLFIHHNQNMWIHLEFEGFSVSLLCFFVEKEMSLHLSQLSQPPLFITQCEDTHWNPSRVDGPVYVHVK